jgi:cell division protease FtsH
MSLGHTRLLPAEDRYIMTRSQFRDMLAHMLGGHVAEDLTFNEISTGASDDIRRATELAHKMVTQYGMSDKLGPRTFGKREEMVFLGREISEQRNYGEKIANMIDEEVHRIIDEAYATARRILNENKDKLKLIAEKLVAKETLEGKDLDKLFKKKVSKTKPGTRVSTRPVEA